VTTATAPAPVHRSFTRAHLRTLLMVLVLGLAVHVLLPQVGELRHSVRAVEHANWVWLALGLVATVATFLSAAVALTGAAGRPLPFVPTVLAQLASSFANRLAPGSLGGLGVNERYLQRAGLDGPQAGAALALNGVAGVLVHVTALIVAGLAVGRGGVGEIHLPRGWGLLVVVTVALAALGIGLGAPFARRRLLPPLKEAATSLADVARRPRQALVLFGGAIGITSAYALAFGLSLHAFHAHASAAKVAAVYLGGAVVSAASPTPGGLGAMEAALVAGLTGVGVAEGPAITSVLGFRLLTYWLPILPGYLALRHLRQRQLL